MLTTFFRCAFLLWYANLLFAVVLPLWFFRSDKRFLLSFFFLSFYLLSFFLPSLFLPLFPSSLFPAAVFLSLVYLAILIPCYPSFHDIPSMPVFPFIWLSLAFSPFPSMFTLLTIIFPYIAF